MNFFKDLKIFFLTLFKDVRIPKRDKKLVLGIALALIFRIFFIPDWIPYVGKLDILFLIALVMDFFFNVLDQNLVLSHYPWGMKSFAGLKRVANFFSLFAPDFIKDHLWKYTKDPF